MRKDIYIIKNDINDKVYVGQALNTKERFQSHCKPSVIKTDLVARAIQKYGREHFWFEILESQIENYNERERYWIAYYDCLAPKGYNVLPGGEEPPYIAGTDHPEATLTDDQVKALILDLKNTTLSLVELAAKYGFKSNTSVYEFNQGKTYTRDIEYPIRKENPIGKLRNEQVVEILQLLKFSYLSFEDIGKKYGVEGRAISRINKGMFHKQDGETYPIREWKATSNPPKLTYDQVTEVINLLQTTKLPLREIARQFGVDYKDILGIKNGTTKVYRRKDLTYPLRPNN